MRGREREHAWRRRRLLQRLDERGGPSRWQRWKARHPGRALVVVVLVCIAAGAGVVALFQGGGTDADGARGWFLLALLVFVPFAIAAEWSRERETIAEWGRAQERGEQLVPPRDPDEPLSDKVSPATKRHLAVRFGFVLLVALVAGVAALFG